MLPHLEGTCKALSLPGEHLFQASRILPNRMRPVIFHAFGKAKKDAPKVLEELAQLGWETLPIALLGMPHYPAAWVVDTWKPIGGCSFTGSPTALAGNSAFRFCLLMQWHPQVAATLGHTPPDPDVEPVAPLRETNSELLVRQLLQAATDQHSQECRSQAVTKPTSSGLDPQMQQPCLFVPWKRAAELIGIPAVQAVPLPNLREGVLHAVNLLPEPQQQEFRAAYTDAVESIPTLAEPVETLAPLILEDRVKKASQHHLWALVLKHMAEHHGFWLTTATAPPPDCVQIHCGGLGGGALGGSDAPTFDCTNPRVDGTCVYVIPRLRRLTGRGKKSQG